MLGTPHEIIDACKAVTAAANVLSSWLLPAAFFVGIAVGLMFAKSWRSE